MHAAEHINRTISIMNAEEKGMCCSQSDTLPHTVIFINNKLRDSTFVSDVKKYRGSNSA